MERGGQRIGYEFKCAVSAGRADASGLKAGLNDWIIVRGYIVYLGTRRYCMDNGIEVLPTEALLREEM